MKGVGPKLGDVFRKRGLRTVSDLLHNYPRAYEDRRAARNIASLEADQIVSLEAYVVGVRSVPLGRTNRKIYDIVLQDSSGRISCKYFRTPYKGYFQRFQTNQMVRVSGKVINYRGRLEFHHPDLQVVGEQAEEENKDALLPIYSEMDPIPAGKLKRLIQQALAEALHPAVTEPFPSWLMDKYGLLTEKEALRRIHKPEPELAQEYLQFKAPAQRRLIFEELFWLELHMAKNKAGIKTEAAPLIRCDSQLLERAIGSLPFPLTSAQKKVLHEVLEDMQSGQPMHRLVQGDVGSGKTVVALLAAYIASQNDFQTALMVPTEILAEQHFKNAKNLLEPLGVQATLITGSMSKKVAEAELAKVASGEVSFVIGTHALIEDRLIFKNLGLVIVDEQHRFGVEQRNALKKGLHPHFLVMTATPIPRTLAMTVYGDLDVSIIDEMPVGRMPIVTRKVFSSQKAKVYGFMQDQVTKGRQAYIIYPLVEESEKIDLKDAVSEYERLQSEFPQVRFGLLHGKMKPDEKDQVMARFRDGEIQVLVSTTVVEVGVDVPNANLIIIEHAERFGLSQLHQLRGRVGRGAHKSYCVLVLGYALSEEARKRAEVIESTTNGFKIADADLELRGPGEFLGRRQSGLPGFRLANLVRDLAILQEAREAAFEVIAKDPHLVRPEHAALRQVSEIKAQEVVG